MSNTITNVGMAPTSITSGGGLKALNPQQFMKILTTELSHQDPTNPLSSSDFMNEMAALGNLQSVNNMSSSVSNLVQFLQLGSASNMIGKVVSGLDINGSQISGLVTGVLINSGQAALVLSGGNSIPLSSVQSITPAK